MRDGTKGGLYGTAKGNGTLQSTLDNPGIDPDDSRSWLEDRVKQFVDETLPDIAESRGWTIKESDEFKRVVFDLACKDVWYDYVEGRPVYSHCEGWILHRALKIAHFMSQQGADVVEEYNEVSKIFRDEIEEEEVEFANYHDAEEIQGTYLEVEGE